MERLGAAPTLGLVADLRQGKPDLPASARVVFVFPPLRSEYRGMGLDLLASHNAFRRHMQLCETTLAELVDWSLEDVLRGKPGGPPFARLDVSQPVLFATTASLAELGRSLGVRPHAVVGHSVGEIAAAASCGALTLEDAARVAFSWGRSCLRLEGRGEMASLPLAAEAVEERIARWGGRLSIAGLNAPSWTAVTGEEGAVEELLEELAEEDIQGRLMSIPVPAHSAGMAPIHNWFMAELAEISPRGGTIPFYSTVTGDRLDSTGLDAGYWSSNLRQPVLFESAIRALLRDGYDAFVEVGPRPVLTGALEEIVGGRAEVYGDVIRSEVPSPSESAPEEGLLADLATASPHWREQVLLDLVLREVATARELASPAAVAPDRPFKDLGFDSAAAVDLRNALNRATGLRLPATLAFDHPTPADVARRLRLALEGKDGPAAARAEAPSAIDELDAASLVELALEDRR